MEVGLRKILSDLGTQVVDILTIDHAEKSGGRHWFKMCRFLALLLLAP